MKMQVTNDMVFGFNGPNLCLLGSEDDYRKLASTVVDMIGSWEPYRIDLRQLSFVEIIGDSPAVIFASKVGGSDLGVFNSSKELHFELDLRVWERLFRYFVLMSWDKRTYYLNSDEDCLNDFNLMQECNFICSSAF